jgi:hypothetical protein
MMLYAADINQIEIDKTNVITMFRLSKLGFGDYVFNVSPVASSYSGYIRKDDPKNPGYYFMSPLREQVPTDSLELAYIDEGLRSYLNQYFYDKKIVNYTRSHYIKEYNRREFYFDIKSNDTRIRLSGWYGQLIHIIVFCRFDTKENFIKEAGRYYNLGDLDIKKVSYDEEIINGKRRDFFYSYELSGANYKLYGYPFLRNSSDYNPEYGILDLAIFTNRENDE